MPGTVKARSLDEKDWLAWLATLWVIDPTDGPEQDLERLGTLSGCARATNTRMFAYQDTSHGETPQHIYLLLFSFDSPGSRRHFLRLARQFEFDTDKKNFVPPSPDDIRRAKPLGTLLHPEELEAVMKVSKETAASLGLR